MLFSGVLVVLAAAAFWKAEAVGKALKRVYGDRLIRGGSDFGGDARAYTFFVRMGSLPVLALGGWGILSGYIL